MFNKNLNVMSIYKVHNLRENSRPGAWLKYWEDATGLEAGNCHRVDCLSGDNVAATDGAHVQLDAPDDDRWWIVPLCHKCNCQFGAHFSVRGPLVNVADSKVILK